jgi:hypothetical protein
MTLFLFNIFLMAYRYFMVPEGDGGGGGDTGSGASGEGGDGDGDGAGGDSGSDGGSGSGDDGGEGNDGGTVGDGKGKPFAVFPDKESLDERLSRAGKAETKRLAKEFGFQDVDEFKTFVKESKKAAEKAEEAKKAELSEIERLKTEKAETEAQAKENAERVKKLELSVAIRDGMDEADITGKANTKIARALYREYLDEYDCDEDPQAPADFFKALKEDEAYKHLFADPARPDSGTKPPPDGKPSGGDGGKQKADKLSNDEWNRALSSS